MCHKLLGFFEWALTDPIFFVKNATKIHLYYEGRNKNQGSMSFNPRPSLTSKDCSPIKMRKHDTC